MTTQLQTVPVASYDEDSQAQPQARDYTYADSLYSRTPEPTDYPLPNDDLRDILADYTSHTRMVRLAFERERNSLDDRYALLERQTRQLVDSRFEVAEDCKALEVEKAKFNRQRIEKEQEYEERLAELEAREQAQAAADARDNNLLPHFLDALEGMRSDVVAMFDSLESKVDNNADIIAEVHDAVTQQDDLTSCDDLAVQLDTATVRVDRLSDALVALNRARAKDVKRVLEAIAARNQGTLFNCYYTITAHYLFSFPISISIEVPSPIPHHEEGAPRG